MSAPASGCWIALGLTCSNNASASATLHDIRDAHADYYLSWLVALQTIDPTDETVDGIGLEYPNIRAALVWSISQTSPRAAELVAAFGVAWYLLSRFSDAVSLGEQALAIVVGDDPGLWARGVGMLALARLVAGDAAFVLGSVPTAAEMRRPMVTTSPKAGAGSWKGAFLPTIRCR